MDQLALIVTTIFVGGVLTFILLVTIDRQKEYNERKKRNPDK
tara:strand:- start:2363 stop:2488 length:126 start_codon:yes stop_codon:yes gene_type:complete